MAVADFAWFGTLPKPKKKVKLRFTEEAAEVEVCKLGPSLESSAAVVIVNSAASSSMVEHKKRKKSSKASSNTHASSSSGFEDERFAAAKFDPRFSRFPTKRKKEEKSDDARLLEEPEEDERFAAGLRKEKEQALKIDKRGKAKPKVRSKKDQPESSRRQSEAATDTEESESGSGSGSDSESESESESESGSSSFEDVLEVDEFKKKRLQAVERFGIGAFAGRYLEDDELEEEDLAGFASKEEYQKLAQGERCLLDEATSRVAVVDLDWQNFTALDILAVLRSFAPAGQNSAEAVERVTVYKSDYGIERMKIEDKEGPGAFFKQLGSDNEDDDNSDSDSDSDSDSEKDSSDSEKEIDKDALRAYERSKLRYFFAIAKFSSAKIAKYIYDACDGLEFDRSSSRFDLRFVGEEDQVEKDRPFRDEATDVPVGYNAPMDGQSFYNSALQHTNVNLTWDQGDKKRANAFRQQFQNIRNNDNAAMDANIQAYLASDSSDDDEDKEKNNSDSESEDTKRKKFRSLLNLGNEGQGGRSKKTTGRAFASRDWKAEEEKDVDMVVTFDSGIDLLGDKLKTKHDRLKSGKGEATVWEKVLEERKQKKKNRKSKAEDSQDEAEDNQAVTAAAAAEGEDDDGFNDPFFNEVDDKIMENFDEEDFPQRVESASKRDQKKKKKKSKESRRDEEKNQAELDLLLTSDDQLQALSSGHKMLSVAGDDSDEEDGRRKRKKSKSKKGKGERSKSSEKKDGFHMDLEDPRFSQMFSSKEYALDPTEPQYKNLSDNIVKKFHSTKKVTKGDVQKDHSKAEPSGGINLASAVESLKRKLKNRGTR